MRELWWAWFVAEPAEVLRTIGDDCEAAKRTSSSSTSSSNRPKFHATHSEVNRVADEDDKSPMPRRCALEGPSHFPPTETPDDEGDYEIVAENPTVEDLASELTRNCTMA